jgi:antitoxin ParD1/3/4
MRDALRALQQRRREDALKLERLRAAIDEGDAALARGDYIEVDDAGLEAFMDELLAAGSTRSR